MKKEPDVSTPSAAYEEMLPRWELMESLLGGTETMRSAGTRYLPKHAREDQDGYNERLAVSTLKNYTEQTLGALEGRPFSEPVKVNDDVPETIKALLDDIDLQGNNLDVFARRWFRTGVAKAFAHVLIDFPRLDTNVNGRPRTLDDDRREGVRPFWVLLPPENVTFLDATVIGGREVLTHARVRERELVRDGWGQKIQDRVKVFNRLMFVKPGTTELEAVVSVELWELRRIKGKEVWVVVEQYNLGINEIPIVTFYTNRGSLMLGKSPIQDLAHLNVTHWQSSSDQRNVLTVARFPMLAVNGALDEDVTGAKKKLVVGPRQWLHMPDPSGSFYYVEHSGAAIEAGAKDLADLEETMSTYGAAFLRRDPGDPTATERALDSAEAISPLQAWCMVFDDAIAQALSITAKWLGDRAGKGGSVETFKDFVEEMTASESLRTLDSAQTRRVISRVTFLGELQRHGVLSQDFDEQKDKALLEAEAADLMSGMADEDLDPGAPNPPEPEEDPPKPVPKPPKEKPA